MGSGQSRPQKKAVSGVEERGGVSVGGVRVNAARGAWWRGDGAGLGVVLPAVARLEVKNQERKTLTF